MKKMRKILFICVCVVLLTVAFAGCSEPAVETPAEEPDDTVAETPAEEPDDTAAEAVGALGGDRTGDGIIKIGYDSLSDNVFPTAIGHEIETHCEEKGWEYAQTVNENNSENAVQNAAALITQGCDYLVCYVLDEGTEMSIQQMCDEKGLGVVFIGVEIEGYVTVGGGNYDGGFEGGKRLAEFATQEKWPGEEIDLVIVGEFPQVGKINEDMTNGMIDGAASVIGDFSDKMFRVDGEFDVMKATEGMAGALTANPDAERILVLSTCDAYTGIGAWNAATAVGREDQLAMMMFHLDDEMTPYNLLTYPDIWVCITDLPGWRYGQMACELIDRFHAGEDLERTIYDSGYLMIDQENVEEYYEVITPDDIIS